MTNAAKFLGAASLTVALAAAPFWKDQRTLAIVLLVSAGVLLIAGAMIEGVHRWTTRHDHIWVDELRKAQHEGLDYHLGAKPGDDNYPALERLVAAGKLKRNSLGEFVLPEASDDY